MNFSVEWFLHWRKPIATLRDHSSVGAHTDIFMIEPDGAITRFFWSHPTFKPFGNPMPVQCKKCFSLQPWTLEMFTIQKGELAHVSIRCKSCKDRLSFARTSVGKITRVGQRGQHDGTERGEWFYQMVDVSSWST